MSANADERSLAGLPPNRIEALADGIFAVAMTVLVLEVHIPDLPEGASPDALERALWALGPKLASFAVGFVILGTLWIGHHYQFHYIRRSDRPLLWVNLLFLLAICSLPFAVAILGAWGPSRVACGLYGAVLLVAGSCLLAQWIYATRGGRLTGPIDARVVSALRGRVMLGMLGYGTGLALAFVAPRASLACYAAMPLVYLLPGRIDRHVKR